MNWPPFYAMLLFASFVFSNQLGDQLDFLRSIQQSMQMALSPLSTATSTCCELLAAILPNRTFTSTSTAYISSTESYFSQQEQQTIPDCIVIPDSLEDVSRSIKVLAEAGSYRDSCQFAVRGGGHSPASGFANINAGVTIDLSRLNSITIAKDRQTVSIGAGSHWADVDAVLTPQKLAITLGRVPGVGVGGFLLGGGISYYMPTRGLGCDNIASLEIVLASGEITTVNRTSHSDLFRALKGGSNNFGVVTRFDVEVWPQGDVWGGLVQHDINNRLQLFELLQKAANSTETDEKATITSNVAFQNGSWSIVTGLFYSDPIKPAFFNPLLDLPMSFDLTGIHNMTGLLAQNQNLLANGRWMFMTFTIKIDASLLEQFYQMANETASTISDVRGLTLIMSVDAFLQTARRKAAQTEGNSLGLDDEDGDLFVVLIETKWDDEIDDERINVAVTDLVTKCEYLAKDLGKWNEFKYLPYSDPSQRPISGYGEKNVESMVSVSREYDPDQLFQQAVPGGFKLLQS